MNSGSVSQYTVLCASQKLGRRKMLSVTESICIICTLGVYMRGAGGLIAVLSALDSASQFSSQPAQHIGTPH